MVDKVESIINEEYEREITLATKGFFYGDKLLDGKIIVEAWDQKTERRLFNDGIPFNKRLDSLITDCTNIDEFDLTPKDLTLVDKQHIFFIVRCMSVGPEHWMVWRCSECSKKATVEINLDTKLEVIYAESSEDFEVTLPIKGDTIGWRLLIGRDEQLIDKYVKRLKRKGNSESDPAYLYRTALRITSINGDTNLDISNVVSYLETLKGRDVVAVRESIVNSDIGIDTEIEVECNWCQFLNDVILPMDKNFFRTAAYIRRYLERKDIKS